VLVPGKECPGDVEVTRQLALVAGVPYSAQSHTVVILFEMLAFMHEGVENRIWRVRRDVRLIRFTKRCRVGALNRGNWTTSGSLCYA